MWVLHTGYLFGSWLSLSCRGEGNRGIAWGHTLAGLGVDMEKLEKWFRVNLYLSEKEHTCLVFGEDVIGDL